MSFLNSYVLLILLVLLRAVTQTILLHQMNLLLKTRQPKLPPASHPTTCPVVSAAVLFLRLMPPTEINYDYGLQTVIQSGFGEGEFTFDLWVDLIKMTEIDWITRLYIRT